MDFSQFAPFWILFSLLSAFFHASRLAVTKHLSFSFSAKALTLYVNLASVVVTFPLIFWNHNFPVEDYRYVGAVLLGGMISGLGGWSLNHAIKVSEISLVGPVITLTPGFVIVIEWLITGDLPSSIGLIGIALLVVGSYILSVDRGMTHWFTPLARLFTVSGSRYTLAASACFATAATFGRVGVRLSDPLSFSVMVSMVNPLILFILFSLHDRHFYREVFNENLRREARPLLLLGALFALMRIADQIALSLTLASYAMSVKRTAGMFSVLLGRLLFHEHRIPEKLIASAVMLLGLFALTQD
ncbi:MAG: DMT family transporter [Pseudomonadota bacterium]|nr:DMT family transporter [Pseudomonadota bacterium]